MPGEFDPYQEWLGIEPHEHPVDHYRLLGLRRFETDPALVHEAADLRMTEVRLHQTGPRGSYTQQLLNEIAVARICLVSTETRQAYDAQLASHASSTTNPAERLPLPGPPPAPPVSPPVSPAVLPMEQPAVPVNAVPTAAAAELGPDRSASGWSNVLVVLTAVLLVGVVIFGVLLVGARLFRSGLEEKTASDHRERLGNIENRSIAASDELKAVDEKRLLELVNNQEGSGEIRLTATIATLHGKTLRRQLKGGEDQIENWTNPEDYVSWKFKVLRPGYFRAIVTYTAAEDANKGTCLLQIDNESPRELGVRSSAGTADLTGEKMIMVKHQGEHELSVKVGDKPGKEFMVLKSILLVPRDQK